MVRSCCLFIFLLLVAGCGTPEKKNDVSAGSYVLPLSPADEEKQLFPFFPEDTKTERKMRAAGLVDIQEIEPSIQVFLVYATSENFVGRVLYPDIHKAFMLPEMALKLAKVQGRLKDIRPDLSLLIYDAARPMSVQQAMWEQVRGTDKRVYVSNPRRGGGLHNYGAAVDLTLADSIGHALPMGSPFDYFGDEARPDNEDRMVKEGKISPDHLQNRLLLRTLMVREGFRVLPGEWWHFNLMTRAEAKEKLPVID